MLDDVAVGVFIVVPHRDRVNVLRMIDVLFPRIGVAILANLQHLPLPVVIKMNLLPTATRLVAHNATVQSIKSVRRDRRAVVVFYSN